MNPIPVDFRSCILKKMYSLHGELSILILYSFMWIGRRQNKENGDLEKGLILWLLFQVN